MGDDEEIPEGADVAGGNAKDEDDSEDDSEDDRTSNEGSEGGVERRQEVSPGAPYRPQEPGRGAQEPRSGKPALYLYGFRLEKAKVDKPAKCKHCGRKLAGQLRALYYGDAQLLVSSCLCCLRDAFSLEGARARVRTYGHSEYVSTEAWAQFTEEKGEVKRLFEPEAEP